MKCVEGFRRMLLVVALVAFCLVGGRRARAEEKAAPLKQGDSFTLGSSRATLKQLDTLPYIESEYTKRFTFDTFENPKLKELRERYHLDEVVAPGKTEFDRQFLLLDWVNHRFKKFGKPSCAARGALDVLAAVDEGNSFFCSQYGEVMVSAAASMGWVDRPLALRRLDTSGRGGSTEHTSTEMWSNQYRKWMLFDPTFAMYVVKDGASQQAEVPLSAYEFRQEWYYHDGKDVTFVLDKDRKRYHKSDMPVLRGRYPGFGDLVFDAGATDVYAFIGYVPNTDVMTRGFDYGKMFITKDHLCDATKWHERTNPADPAHDPYFPINQAAMTLTADGASLRVSLKTLTPNFKTYQARIDGGEWKATQETFAWTPHLGKNALEVKATNRFGVDGPVSTAVVEIAAGENR